MGSRREEERNEKIIRGLMKLPPNRRCINCNSLGPQYVCTNFWTFVCTACSGIHREFTHRVKSVSMAKFNSQEVEALQNGGNQRAREIYLKDWDSQRFRLPDNSKADKIREFIKNVYVDRRFSGSKSLEKPPRDMQHFQKLSSHEDETRRASSYHSYSQSPPYDFQYEERRYGKHAPALSRKPGSDRGLYDRKFSSFLSPSRLSDHSPNHKDIGSPSSDISRDSSCEDVLNCSRNSSFDSHAKRDGGIMPHPQRTASSPGSFGTFSNQLQSFKSDDSVDLASVASKPENSVEALSTYPSVSHSLSQSPVLVDSDGLDLFNAPLALQITTSTTSDISMSHLTDSSAASLYLFQTSSIPKSHELAQTNLPSSTQLFSNISEQPPAVISAGSSSDMIVPQNEGWATFENQIPASIVSQNLSMAKLSSDSNSESKLEHLIPLTQWSSFQDISHKPSSSMPTVWNEAHNIQSVPNTASVQLWNAFDDSPGQVHFQSVLRSTGAAMYEPSTSDQYICSSVSEESKKVVSPSFAADSVPPMLTVPSYSSVGEHQYSGNRKSTNPFDLPDDPSTECGEVPPLWDMSCLEAILPTPVTGGANQHWFPQDPVAYLAPAKGAVGFMKGQGSNSQILKGPAQGPVASLGGNPFA